MGPAHTGLAGPQCSRASSDRLLACAQRLLHAGRQLADESTVASLALLPWSTLHLTSRLRGAGGDGGSTGAESRSCYLEMYQGKKALKVGPAGVAGALSSSVRSSLACACACGPQALLLAWHSFGHANMRLHVQVNPAEEQLARWTRCRLSNELLSPPCVIDELGMLYNKDAVVRRGGTGKWHIDWAHSQTNTTCVSACPPVLGSVP